MDVDGITVMKNDLLGVRLAIETRHPIQICFICIGDDADPEIARLLSEATGGEYQCVTDENIENVLDVLTRYF